jgi:hypothetical protein
MLTVTVPVGSTLTPSTLTFSGTGVQAVVAFSWTNGGTVGAWGNNNGNRTITIRNTGGAGSALTLGANPVVVDNVTQTQFAVFSTNCAANQVLGNNQSCNVIVSRTRPAAGVAAGTLTINGTGGLLPAQVLNLSGT